MGRQSGDTWRRSVAHDEAPSFEMVLSQTFLLLLQLGTMAEITDFLSILQSVPEDQRASLVQQYLKDVRERQRLDEARLAAEKITMEERAAEKKAELEERAAEKKAELERLKADNNRKLADLRRAANERLAVKSWCDTMVSVSSLLSIPRKLGKKDKDE